MKDKLISFKTALLAKLKGFDTHSKSYFGATGLPHRSKQHLTQNSIKNGGCIRCTQSVLLKFIREKRNVVIVVDSCASGYYWFMSKADTGTNLGSDNESGTNDSGCWNRFEDALENALQVQLSYDLPKNLKKLKSWSVYSTVARKKFKKNER